MASLIQIFLNDEKVIEICNSFYEIAEVDVVAHYLPHIENDPSQGKSESSEIHADFCLEIVFMSRFDVVESIQSLLDLDLMKLLHYIDLKVAVGYDLNHSIDLSDDESNIRQIFERFDQDRDGLLDLSVRTSNFSLHN